MLSDEAVLALSSLLGDMVKTERFALELVLLSLLALLMGSRTAIFHSVLVSYTVQQLFRLPLDNFMLACLLLVVTVRVQPHFPDVDLITVVTYTVAAVLAANLLAIAQPITALLVLLVGLALAVYVAQPGRWGAGGQVVFRTAKFVLVKEGVRRLLVVGTGVIAHPFLWLGVGLVLICLTRTFAHVGAEELALTDALLHSAAAAVAAHTIGLPTRVTPVELAVAVGAALVVLHSLPPSPIRNILRSVALFVAILNLHPLGILPVLILLLADQNARRPSANMPAQ